MLTVEINGRDVTSLLNPVSVTARIKDIARNFQFTTTIENDGVYPFKINDSVKIYADDEIIVTGKIEVISCEEGLESGDAYTCSGRSLTGTLVNSTISSNIVYTAPITLEDVAKSILEDAYSTTNLPVGVFTGALILDKNPDPPVSIISRVYTTPFSKEDLIIGKVGETYHSFLSKYAKKKHVIFTCTGASDLEITNGQGVGLDARLFLIKKKNNPSNTVKYSAWSADTSEQFFMYTVNAQNPLGNIFDIAVVDDRISRTGILGSRGSVIQSLIDQSRKYNFVSTVPLSEQESRDRAIWEANTRRSEMIKYAATVAGHSQNGVVWDINVPVRVDDARAGFDIDMVISEVNYNYSDNKGSETRVTCITPDAYTLNITPTDSQSLSLQKLFFRPNQ